MTTMGVAFFAALVANVVFFLAFVAWAYEPMIRIFWVISGGR